jgi:hypothetical protein
MAIESDFGHLGKKETLKYLDDNGVRRDCSQLVVRCFLAYSDD